MRSGRHGRKVTGIVTLLVALAIPTIAATPAYALAPTVGAFLPLSGPVGTSVTIAGLFFDDSSTATSVRFNGTAATFTVNSTLQITATVPAGATTGVISVTDADGTGSSPLPFTVNGGGGGPIAPVVAAFLPLSGPVGTPVTITGAGFTGATSVKFHGTTATFTVGSATQITTTVPAGATTGTVSVTTPDGTGTSALPFTVGTVTLPAIQAFLPVSGPVGTPVTITGTGFTGATSVKFNGTSATFTPGSPTQITTTVPPGATTGTLSVTTPTGSVTSLLPFTVTAGTGITKHDRSLAFKGRRIARGRLSAADGFAPCTAGVAVKIQRRGRHGWKTIASGATTTAGRFSMAVTRRGKYRALAPKLTLNGGTDVCGRIVSRPKRLGA